MLHRYTRAGLAGAALLLAAPLVLPISAQQARTPAAGTPAAGVPPCSHGPADDEAVMVTATVRAERARIRAVVDTTLRGLGYAVSGRETTLDQVVTEPRFTWPVGTESEPWHGAVNPGVQIIVDLEPVGDSTRLHVASSAVCALAADSAGPSPAKVESNLETLSAVQVATALATAFAPAAPDSSATADSAHARADSTRAPADSTRAGRPPRRAKASVPPPPRHRRPASPK
jgi:hypothetical protein